MELFIKIAQFILSLSLLIVLHEFGHYLPAKLFKIRVEKFFLFFDAWGKKLFSFKKGETEYGIGWLPLGGYVKIAGMIDESMDKEQLKQPPQAWEFRTKPAWQRLIVMLGGVTVNFLLAILIYIGMAYFYGDKYLPNQDVKDGVMISDSIGFKLGLNNGDKILTIDNEVVKNFSDIQLKILFGKEITINRHDSIMNLAIPNDFISQIIDADQRQFISLRIPFVIGSISKTSPNLERGLKLKDEIVAINTIPVHYFDEVSAILQNLKGQEVPVMVLRDGKSETLNLKIDTNGKLGVGLYDFTFADLEKMNIYTFETKDYSLLQSVPVGLEKSKEKLLSYVQQLKAIFNPSTGAYKGVGGFIAIGSIFPSEWNWQAFWSITAFLSLILGFMNLLPIPALDGGHVMFTLFEIITRKKPSDKFLEYAQITGFIILIALLLFANGNDIYKLFR
ncbi:MAG: RIP metalloprotease RseP [Flavobacteriales bacterium CG_4_9_14_0_2_um_filter_35_242]|nr:RIP metalloprotease RseP [Zetaproteobacteria bacterium]OIO11535.1 MAG: RIP metalloprotease RseP [Flavobacteriaceae bacterium CG1_02_35_72]PIV15947.1 MAG: RIP metalloprotease RseP [Flavobacteriales bacterium CG03_land_8_20_14_0_80_35_15]PIX07509.1 MAG: RIP metalloprotease RseP [Flavobacteriales bacterium CG_4_8_14_3_um_filter_35_10]PJC60605.1 MAG: RIP metalloprotease RseP [Flavobacteriales bacterium CG_4_9_14_0_2_um_filter_35_242]